MDVFTSQFVDSILDSQYYSLTSPYSCDTRSNVVTKDAVCYTGSNIFVAQDQRKIADQMWFVMSKGL